MRFPFTYYFTQVKCIEGVSQRLYAFLKFQGLILRHNCDFLLVSQDLHVYSIWACIILVLSSVNSHLIWSSCLKGRQESYLTPFYTWLWTCNASCVWHVVCTWKMFVYSWYVLQQWLNEWIAWLIGVLKGIPNGKGFVWTKRWNWRRGGKISYIQNPQ